MFPDVVFAINEKITSLIWETLNLLTDANGPPNIYTLTSDPLKVHGGVP